MRSDGTGFTDHEIHTALKRKGFLQLNQGLDKNEWFNCTIKDVISAIFPTVASASSIGVSLVIIMDCVMTFFGSSANDACFNAWLTESVSSEDRGKMEGINSMMPLVAILVVFGGFMSLKPNLASSWTIIYTTIGVVVTLIGVLGCFLIEEKAVKIEENSSYFKNILY